MKNRIFRSILYLVALVTASSCQLIYDNYEEAEELSEKFPVTFVMQTRASYDLPPVVESVRLFFFQDGVCKVNQFVGSSNLSVSTSKSTIDGYYDVVVNQEFSLQMGAKYDIYAVMNESGYMSDLAGSGSTTLADKLASVSVGEMNYQEFLDILDTKLKYDSDDALDTDEQPFVMLSYKKGYTFEATTPGEVVTVRMSDEGAASRPMALLHMDMITSKAPSGSTATDLDLISNVFVLDVKLVNVPDGYYFNHESAGDGTTPTMSTIQLGSPGTKGYYDREWWGKFSQTVSADVSSREHVEGYAFYRVTLNNGNGCWTFTTQDKAYEFDTWNNAEYKYVANNGNLATLISNSIDAFFRDYPVEAKFHLDALTVLESEMTGDCSWSIPLDYNIYIPENFSTNTTNSTGFLVKLALADDPHLNVEDLPVSFWNSSDVEWEKKKTIYSYDQEVYYSSSDNSHSFLGRYAKSCWDEDDTMIEMAGSPSGKYNYFVGGLSRVLKGTYGPKTLTLESHESLSCEWDISTSDTKVMEVFVPINNNNVDLKPDANDDYSVRRNQRYNVTLHVMKSTYDNLASRAVNGSTLPVTVKATIEKVTENQ